jgi:hypothetical protein
MSVQWDSPLWGKPGHNVHIAEDGSFVPDRHDITSNGEH